MTKIIQALNELEQHWAVMKHSPGMPQVQIPLTRQ